ncbi:hypothetical protein F441_22758, partial [Phytophthora nicotianae CJ01A1]
MVAVTGAQLPPESLHAGDAIEYYSPAFVCGDRRGKRLGVVLKIAITEDNPFPVVLDTQELLPLISMVCRRFDGAGNVLLVDSVRWRKLRSNELVPGTFEAPTAADHLRAALKAAVDHDLAASGLIRRAEREGTGNRLPNRFALDPVLHAALRGHSRTSSTPNSSNERLPSSSTSSP